MSTVSLLVISALYLVACISMGFFEKRPWMAGVMFCYAASIVCLIMDGKQ